MALNTMNAMRHVVPFKERVVNMLSVLSDVSGTILKKGASTSALTFIRSIVQSIPELAPRYLALLGLSRYNRELDESSSFVDIIRTRLHWWRHSKTNAWRS